MCSCPFFCDERVALPADVPKELSELLDKVAVHIRSGCYDAARYHLEHGVRQLPKDIDRQSIYLLLTSHLVDVRDGRFSKAVKSLDTIRRSYATDPLLQSYITQISISVLQQCQDEYLAFFLTLPAKSQQEVLQEAITYLDKTERWLEAIRMCILIVKAFPSTTSIFGPFAIGLVHRSEAKYRPVSIKNVYRTLLALDILPLVYALPVQLVVEQTHHGIPVPDFASSLGVVTSSLPEMKSLPETSASTAVTSLYSEMKSLPEANASTASHSHAMTHDSHDRDPAYRNLQFPSPDKAQVNTSDDNLRIVIQTARFVRGLEKAAAFHLARRDWRRLFELFLAAFSSCGFAKEEETQTVSDPVVTPDDFLGEMFGMHHGKVIRDEFAMPTMACCACLCAMEYYKCVMGTGDEKCYIPIGNATTGEDAKKRKRPARSSASASSGSPPEPEPLSHHLYPSAEKPSHVANENHFPSTRPARDVMKVTNLINPPEADRIAMPPPAVPKRNGVKPMPKSKAFQQPVSRAVQARKWLDRLHRCVSHMAASWPQHHQVLTEYVKMFDLPFEVHNAILLARGDLAFSDDRYDMAIDMYQMLQDRIVTAWEHRQQPMAQVAAGLMDGKDSSQDLQYQMEKMHLHEAGVKSMTPTLLPFTVLYRTALAASAIDADMDPRAELLFLLSTLPFQPLTQAQFDRDAEVMAASAIPSTDTSMTKLRLVSTDPTALATRALKHLSSLLVSPRGDFDDQLQGKLQDLFTVSVHATSRLSRSVFQSLVSLFWWNIESRRQGLHGSALEDSSDEEANVVS